MSDYDKNHCKKKSHKNGLEGEKSSDEKISKKCKGSKGDPGRDGCRGPEGPQGKKGCRGPAGEIGPTGPAGSSSGGGATGPTGNVGPTGPYGIAGSVVNSINDTTGNLFLDGSSSVGITESPSGTFTFSSSAIENATSLNIPNTLVERDDTGSFVAQNVDMTLAQLRVGANSVNILADGALGSTYDYKFPAIPSTGNAQSITTSGSTNVFYDLHAQHEVTVRKNPGPDEFSSLASAIASIPLAGSEAPSDTNRYAIYIHPGTYSEPACIVPSYVYVIGVTSGSVMFEPSGTGYSLITLNENSGIYLFSIKETDSAFPAIHSTGSSTICKIDLIDCLLGILLEPATTNNKSNIQLIKYIGICDYAIKITDSNILGGLGNQVTITSLDFQGKSTNCVMLDGLNSNAVFKACSLKGDTTGNAFIVNNGAILNSVGVYLDSWNNGIYVPITSGTPKVTVSGIMYENCTTNINIIDPSTTGYNDGYSNYTKTSIPLLAPFFSTEINSRVLTVGIKGADFTSIFTALASITDNSPSIRFTIYVFPGTYIEPKLVMKPYVNLLGVGINTCVIKSSDPTGPLITLSGYSEVNNFTLLADMNDPPEYLIQYLGGQIGTLTTLNNIIFYTSRNCGYINTSEGISYLQVLNSFIDPTAPITKGFFCEDSAPNYYSGTLFLINFTWTPLIPQSISNVDTIVTVISHKSPSSTYNIYLAILYSQFFSLMTPGGIALDMTGSVYAAIRSNCFYGFETGIRVNNSAESSFLLISSISLDLNNVDLNIQNPNTVGAIQGAVDYTKTKKY